MAEQRVIKKAIEVPEETQQPAAHRTTLTLRDAVATRGLIVQVKTHLKAGALVKWP